MDVQLARSDGLPQGVGCPAGVCPSIFRIGVHNVQGDESETVGLGEPRAGFQRNIVAEPFDSHRLVRDGNQTALEMGPLALLDFDTLQRRRKHRRLIIVCPVLVIM